MFNGSRKSVDKISGTFKDLMGKISSGSPSKGAGSASSFDYDQLNDQLEKASLPSPDLPSPDSVDSASGGFSNHPAFDGHQETSEVLEGFVCPLCLLSFTSPATLQKHYSINHPKQLQEQEIELLRSQVGALMESKDLLKEELARIKSQSEDERLRIVNQMKERESEFFEQLKSEKRLREQFLKDQVEHNLISLAEDTQRLSPTPTPTASCSEFKSKTMTPRQEVAEKETLTEYDVNVDVEQFKEEIVRLQSELKIANETCEKLRRDIDKLKDAYIKLKKELTDERNTQNSLKLGHEGLNKEINKLQSDFHNVMDENETLLTEKNNIITSLTEKVALKEEEITSLKNLLEARVNAIAKESTSEIEKLTSGFAQERLQFTNEIQKLSIEISDLMESVNAKSIECQNAVTSSREMSDKLSQLRQEFKESTLKNESKCKSLKELADTARKRSDELTTIKFDLENKLKESLDRVEAEKQNNETLVIEITRLKGEIVDLKMKHDEILHALHELGREHSTLQVQGEKLKSKIWVDDDAVKECTRCSKPFSVTTRKHHCRSCFNIFCSDCSPLRRSDGSVSSPSLGASAASLLKGSLSGGTRVCEDCFGQSSSTKSS